MRFVDRQDAGRRLASDLSAHDLSRPVVVALPRGGVPVAVEVATALDAPLDVLVVRILHYPRDPDRGMGAVAEGGLRFVDPEVVPGLDVTPEQIDGVAAVEDHEVRRRVERYRRGRPPLPVDGRVVVVVDDGVITGQTARSAIDALRERAAAHVVLAVPVGPAHTVTALREHADRVVCLHAPRSFGTLRQWYDHYPPVGDADVADLLDSHAEQHA